MISKEEYRKILNDYTSTEEQVDKRLKYLEALLRNVVRNELECYAKTLNKEDK
jgi:hypothetical protein